MGLKMTSGKYRIKKRKNYIDTSFTRVGHFVVVQPICSFEHGRNQDGTAAFCTKAHLFKYLAFLRDIAFVGNGGGFEPLTPVS